MIKILLILFPLVILFVITVFYLALAPKITDLGLFPRYQPILHRSLVLSRAVILYDIRNEPYRFCSRSLQVDSRLPFPKTCVLPAGSVIRINELKNYYNSVSGSSTIYALGESRAEDGALQSFEYEYGTFPGRINTRQLPELPVAAWQ